ncbi:MAG: hypothetical protein KJ971_03745 [Firmicutes bacterium]|nr:hypothetical protein [Bacillota bacterium]
MKKFFGNVVILLSLLLVSAVAIPWNNIHQWWGLTFPLMSDNEIYVKAGIGGLLFILSLIFLFIGNHEYKEYGHVKRSTANAAFFPMYMYSIGALVYLTALTYFIYKDSGSGYDFVFLLGLLATTVNLIGFGHIIASGFKSRSNLVRIIIFVFLVELMAGVIYVSRFIRVYKITNAAYGDLYTYNHILIGAVAIGLYIVHAIVMTILKKKHQEETELESEIDEVRQEAPVSKKHDQKEKEHVVEKTKNSTKTIMVSKEQTIVSGGQNLDPTNMLYEDINVDPEFSKTSNQDKQVSSIEYYIEKPKMFKPLDPTFDKLVEYVRELPQVVTKLSDEKITFYVDRKPFLVLMNYGNYYRMAFKYELEKGIRLIIKYPTISKNKGTKEELWFKANNYGDLPKEVVYQIVKTSYDNVNA